MDKDPNKRPDEEDGLGAGAAEYAALANGPKVTHEEVPFNDTIILQRKPVIESGEKPESLGRQWQILTEVIRREITDNPALRERLINYTSAPVNQMLPYKALEDLAGVSPQLRRRLDRFSDGRISSYVATDEVPEDYIGKDFHHTTRLESMQQHLENYQRWERDPEDIDRSIKLRAESGSFEHGITEAEVRLAKDRYTLARDIKVLALQAEAVENNGIHPDEAGAFSLPSGIKGECITGDSEIVTDLVDPVLWQSRKQLKDRVYRASIDGRNYILKERKTGRHTSTARGGHFDGLTSAEEYHTGRRLNEEGSVRSGEIQVGWEEPLAYVEFPDGFQFVIFDEIKELVDGVDPHLREHLTTAIIKNKEEFEDEYADVIAHFSEELDHPAVIDYSESPLNNKSKGGIRSRLRQRKARKDLQLSFNDFAYIKSRYMINRSRDALEESAWGQGINDIDGYENIKRMPDPNRPEIEIVGYDYEYVQPMSEEKALARRRTRLRSYRDTPRSIMDRYDDESREQAAAYMCMLKRDGVLKGVEGQEDRD